MELIMPQVVEVVLVKLVKILLVIHQVMVEMVYEYL